MEPEAPDLLQRVLSANKYIAAVHGQFRFSQWQFLLTVKENPCRTPSEIGELIGCDLATVSVQLAVFGTDKRRPRYQGFDWVDVIPNPIDAREKLLRITDKGEAFLEGIRARLNGEVS